MNDKYLQSSGKFSVSSQVFYDDFHKKSEPLRKVPKYGEFSLKYHLAAYSPHLKKGKSVLDIGCGASSMSFYAASKGCEVTGIDVSVKAIEAARIAAKNLGYKNIDFKNIDLFSLDKQYDIIVLSEVLEHMPDDQSALKKICSLLRSRGKLLMSVPLQSAPLHRIYLKMYGNDPFDIRVGHLRRYDVKTIEQLLNDSGFEVLEMHENEGLLRNWLFNGKVGSIFMKLNRGRLVKSFVSFLDENVFCPMFGYSDVILVAEKKYL